MEKMETIWRREQTATAREGWVGKREKGYKERKETPGRALIKVESLRKKEIKLFVIEMEKTFKKRLTEKTNLQEELKHLEEDKKNQEEGW